MNKLKLVYRIIILFIVAIPISSQAGEEKVGTSAASFLKIGVGARATGMGEAFCAVADDPTAMYWNPAGLSLIEGKQLTYIHNFWFEDITTGFLGYAHPFKDFSLGVGIDYLTMGEVEETTELQPRGTGKKFRVEDDTAGIISYARRMGGNLSLGMNVKYVQQNVANESAAGYAADLGLLCKLSPLRLGLAVQNIGTSMKFVEKEFPLPFNIKAGMALSVQEFSLCPGCKQTI